MFEELLQVIIVGLAKHGSVYILEFKKSAEYQYINELFENSFLNNQVNMLDKAC